MQILVIVVCLMSPAGPRCLQVEEARPRPAADCAGIVGDQTKEAALAAELLARGLWPTSIDLACRPAGEPA